MQCAKPITQYSAVAKQAPCRPITHTRVRCCASASKNTINWGAAALAAVTVLVCTWYFPSQPLPPDTSCLDL
eukprot:1161127-Pelagomonas_calceolata.AAC.10